MAQQNPGQAPKSAFSAIITLLKELGASEGEIMAFRMKLVQASVAARRGNTAPAQEIITYLTEALTYRSTAAQPPAGPFIPNCS